MSVKDQLVSALSEALAPTWLEVVDESHLHAGHGGWRPEGETHFRVRIVSAAFVGKSRLDRHRAINAVAAPALQAGLHALAIEARASGEPGFPRRDATAIDARDGHGTAQ